MKNGKHRKLDSQQRIMIAHTVGGSRFFKIEGGKKIEVQMSSFDKDKDDAKNSKKITPTPPPTPMSKSLTSS